MLWALQWKVDSVEGFQQTKNKTKVFSKKEAKEWLKEASNTFFLSVRWKCSLEDFACDRLPALHLFNWQKYFDSVKPIKMVDSNFTLMFKMCQRNMSYCNWMLSHMAFSIKMTTKHIAMYIRLKNDFFLPFFFLPSCLLLLSPFLLSFP